MPSPVPTRSRAHRAWAIALAFVVGALTLPSAALAAGWTAPDGLPQSMADGPVMALVPPELEVDRAGNAHAIWVENPFAAPVLKAATKPAGGEWSAPDTLVAEYDEAPISGRLATLTVAPDGSATVAWQDNALLAGTGIWATTRPAGGGWGEPVNISQSAATPTQFGSAGPRAVTDRAGNTTVVWQVGLDMWAATRPAGGAWGTPVQVFNGAEGDTNNLFGLAVDVGADGAVTVAFRVGFTSDFGLYSRTRPTPSGGWGSLETIIDRGNSVDEIQLAISGAGSSTGESTVLWRDGTTGQVRTATRTPNGVWSEPADAGAGSAAQLAYDRHGNATAVWQGSADLQTMRRVAGAWSAATAIPGSDGGAAPQLGSGPDGEVQAVWTASDGTASVVHGARYSGGAWSTPSAISDAGLETAAPQVAVGPIGDVEALWVADTLRAATYENERALGIDWTANGLPASFDLRSWIRYLGGNAGVEPTAGATRPDVNDQNSFRFGHSDAWVQLETGETVIAGGGQIRFSYPAHYIDNRIVDPQVRISPTGLSGRVVSDGQGSGSMADAMNGNWKVEPYQDVHLLDLDVAAGTKVVSADGRQTTWVAVPATITADGAPYLSYEAGTRYGFLTITAPTDPPLRSDTRDPGPPADPIPGDPGPPVPSGPRPDGKRKQARASATIAKVNRKGNKVTLTVSKRLGAKPKKSYRVKLTRKGKTIATGTIRGKKLTLTVRKTGKGKRTKYPKIKGKYTLTPAKGVRGIAKTTLTVRRPA